MTETFRAAELLNDLQTLTQSIQRRIKLINAAWELVRTHQDKGNAVKLGRAVEMMEKNGLTPDQLRTRQREELITFDSVRMRFYTLVLNNFETQGILRKSMEEAIKYWRSMTDQTYDRWLKNSLAAAILDAYKALRFIRPDLHIEFTTRGVDNLAGQIVQQAYTKLVEMLGAMPFVPSRNEFLHRSLVELYPVDDVCPAKEGGYDCSQRQYDDLRLVFTNELRHIDNSQNPAVVGLLAAMDAVEEALQNTEQVNRKLTEDRGEVNEGPYGLRLAEALHNESPQPADKDKQVERRLGYELSRSALLASIAAAEQTRRQLKDALVAAVAETQKLITANPNWHIGTFDGDLKTRRSVLNCLAADKLLRVAANRLQQYLQSYRKDLTRGWAAESLGNEINRLAQDVFNMSL